MNDILPPGATTVWSGKQVEWLEPSEDSARQAIHAAYHDGYQNGVCDGAVSAFRTIGRFSLWKLLRWWIGFGRRIGRQAR